MNKKELLNKLNDIIESQYYDIKDEMFEEMIDIDNINRDVYAYINIETGDIFTDVYKGLEPMEPNPYVFEICKEGAYDMSMEFYECMCPYVEEHYAKELGIHKEWLESEDDFRELLEATGKVEEYEELATEQIKDNLMIDINYLCEDDIADLYTDHIEL